MKKKVSVFFFILLLAILVATYVFRRFSHKDLQHKAKAPISQTHSSSANPNQLPLQAYSKPGEPPKLKDSLAGQIAKLTPEEKQKKQQEHIDKANQLIKDKKVNLAIRELWMARRYGDNPEVEKLLKLYWQEHGESIEHDHHHDL